MTAYPLFIKVQLNEPGVQSYCMMEAQPRTRNNNPTLCMIFHIDLLNNYDQPLTHLVDCMWDCLYKHYLLEKRPKYITDWKCLMFNNRNQKVRFE